VSIGAAALLGMAVWRLTGVYVWPERLQFKFCGMHLLAGALYAVLWMLPIIGADALRRHMSLFEIVRPSRVLASFAIGLWIYGLVSGVSYSVCTRGRLRGVEVLGAEARLAVMRSQCIPAFMIHWMR